MTGDPIQTRPGAAAMQRIRAGALGLACVFLLVMLATTFLRAGDAPLANDGDGAANLAQPADPLATLGVAPGNGPPESAPASRPRPAAPR